MRIAIFQGPERSGDVAGNLQILNQQAANAADRGACLLICSEMFLTGYNIGAEAARHLAQPADGPLLTQAAGIARRHGVALLFGYPERGRGEVVYNAAQLIDADGRLLVNYRKCHLFGDLDRGMFGTDGGLLSVVTLGELRVGILICYDVEFPEAVRLLALHGADLIAVPTALMQPFEVTARILVPARAVENQVFVAYANRCGREGDLTYCGLSSITGPDGAHLSRAGTGEELLVADLDIAQLRASRAQYPYLLDRRPELYAPLCVVGRARSGP